MASLVLVSVGVITAINQNPNPNCQNMKIDITALFRGTLSRILTSQLSVHCNNIDITARYGYTVTI